MKAAREWYFCKGCERLLQNVVQETFGKDHKDRSKTLLCTRCGTKSEKIKVREVLE
jgi:hypothetical protein